MRDMSKKHRSYRQGAPTGKMKKSLNTKIKSNSRILTYWIWKERLSPYWYRQINRGKGKVDPYGWKATNECRRNNNYLRITVRDPCKNYQWTLVGKGVKKFPIYCCKESNSNDMMENPDRNHLHQTVKVGATRSGTDQQHVRPHQAPSRTQHHFCGLLAQTA